MRIHSYFLRQEFWVSAALVAFALLVLLLIIPLTVDIAPSQFVVTLDYGNGQERMFTGHVNEQVSAWDTLQQANAHSFIELDTSSDFYPASIDAFTNGDEGKVWHLYVNEKRIAISPADVAIRSGDHVVWRFE